MQGSNYLDRPNPTTVYHGEDKRPCKVDHSTPGIPKITSHSFIYQSMFISIFYVLDAVLGTNWSANADSSPQ